jgi:hypothetical protein
MISRISLVSKEAEAMDTTFQKTEVVISIQVGQESNWDSQVSYAVIMFSLLVQDSFFSVHIWSVSLSLQMTVRCGWCYREAN